MKQSKGKERKRKEETGTAKRFLYCVGGGGGRAISALSIRDMLLWNFVLLQCEDSGNHRFCKSSRIPLSWREILGKYYFNEEVFFHDNPTVPKSTEKC